MPLIPLDNCLALATVPKKLHTTGSEKDFSIEELGIKNNDWEALNKAFRDILLEGGQ
jgi:hypothetical protein